MIIDSSPNKRAGDSPGPPAETVVVAAPSRSGASRLSRSGTGSMGRARRAPAVSPPTGPGGPRSVRLACASMRGRTCRASRGPGAPDPASQHIGTGIGIAWRRRMTVLYTNIERWFDTHVSCDPWCPMCRRDGRQRCSCPEAKTSRRVRSPGCWMFCRRTTASKSGCTGISPPWRRWLGITRMPALPRFRSMSGRFSHPVMPGEPLTVAIWRQLRLHRLVPDHADRRHGGDRSRQDAGPGLPRVTMRRPFRHLARIGRGARGSRGPVLAPGLGGLA